MRWRVPITKLSVRPPNPDDMNHLLGGPGITYDEYEEVVTPLYELNGKVYFYEVVLYKNGERQSISIVKR